MLHVQRRDMTVSNNNEIEFCRVFKRPELLLHLGISEKTLARLEADGTAPPKVRLSEGRVGFRASDVAEWLAARRETADTLTGPARTATGAP